MTTPLAGLTSSTPLQWPRAVAAAPQGAPPALSFGDLLQQTISDARAKTGAAQSLVQQNLAGEELTLVETFTAMREADLTMRLLMQVRNKLVDAYNELQQLRF